MMDRIIHRNDVPRFHDLKKQDGKSNEDLESIVEERRSAALRRDDSDARLGAAIEALEGQLLAEEAVESEVIDGVLQKRKTSYSSMYK